MAKYKLTSWNPDKGFGFVVHPKIGRVFVHANVISSRPQKGSDLNGFEIEISEGSLEQSDKGWRAKAATLVAEQGTLKYWIGHSDVKANQYGGPRAPIITWSRQLNGKAVPGTTNTLVVTASSQIDASWPEEIRSQAAAMLAEYLPAKAEEDARRAAEAERNLAFEAARQAEWKRILGVFAQIRELFVDAGVSVPHSSQKWLQVKLPVNQAEIEVISSTWDNDGNGRSYQTFSSKALFPVLSGTTPVWEKPSIMLEVCVDGVPDRTRILRDLDLSDFASDRTATFCQAIASTEELSNRLNVSSSGVQAYLQYSRWYLLKPEELLDAVKAASLMGDARRLWAENFPELELGDFHTLSGKNTQYPWSWPQDYDWAKNMVWYAPDILLQSPPIEKLLVLREQELIKWAAAGEKEATSTLYWLRKEVFLQELWTKFQSTAGGWSESMTRRRNGTDFLWETELVTDRLPEMVAKVGDRVVATTRITERSDGSGSQYQLWYFDVKWPDNVIYEPGTLQWVSLGVARETQFVDALKAALLEKTGGKWEVDDSHWDGPNLNDSTSKYSRSAEVPEEIRVHLMQGDTRLTTDPIATATVWYTRHTGVAYYRLMNARQIEMPESYDPVTMKLQAFGTKAKKPMIDRC